MGVPVDVQQMTLRKGLFHRPISVDPKTPRPPAQTSQQPTSHYSSSALPTTPSPPPPTMPALASTTRAIARTWNQHSFPVARAGCTAMQTRNVTSSFNSPFKGTSDTTNIPSFGAYKRQGKGEDGPKMMQYFMVGTMGALASLGAKATVQGRSAIPQGAPEGHKFGR
jgi:hypothetical protein